MIGRRTLDTLQVRPCCIVGAIIDNQHFEIIEPGLPEGGSNGLSKKNQPD
jgi:hypothetical protein